MSQLKNKKKTFIDFGANIKHLFKLWDKINYKLANLAIFLCSFAFARERH